MTPEEFCKNYYDKFGYRLYDLPFNEDHIIEGLIIRKLWSTETEFGDRTLFKVGDRLAIEFMDSWGGNDEMRLIDGIRLRED